MFGLKLDKKDKILLFTGLVGCFQVRILGTFYMAEIIAFAGILFFPVGVYKSNPAVIKMMKMAGLWLVGCILSDLFNHSPLESSLKGAFNIIFLIGQIPFVYWALYDKPSRWLYYFTGMAISTYFNFEVLHSSELDDFEYGVWRIYKMSMLFIALSAILYYKGKHKIAFVVLLGWGLYTLFNNSRNIFLTQTIAVTILYTIDKLKSQSFSHSVYLYRKRIVTIFLSMFVGFAIVDYVYENLASEGYLGELAYEKYMKQKYEDGSVASGRSDFLLSMEFVKDSPIIGYGSFAVDTHGTANKYRAKYGMRLISPKGDDYASNAIPCHSHIMGNWVWHGILAAIWWIYYLSLMWKVFKSGAILCERKMLLLCVSVCLTTSWDIFFSPMGARMGYVYLGIFLIIVYDNFRKLKYQAL